MCFKSGDVICRREGLGIDKFRVDRCDGEYVYFHYLDDPITQYYGVISNYKLCNFEQLSLFGKEERDGCKENA